MALQSREQALRSLIAESEAELTSLPRKELELARLMRELRYGRTLCHADETQRRDPHHRSDADSRCTDY